MTIQSNEAFNRLSDSLKEMNVLSTIEAYRHILEMVEMGCVETELIDYLKALIRMECRNLPKDFKV